MAYKLINAAQARWRSVNAPHLVALVRAGAVFHKGRLLERPTAIAPAEPDPGATWTQIARTPCEIEYCSASPDIPRRSNGAAR